MEQFIINGGGPKLQNVSINDGVPTGYQQLTVTGATQFLTVPSNSNMAILILENDLARWRSDGVAPTGSLGMPYSPLQTIQINNKDGLTNFQIIQDTNAVASPVLNVMYFFKR